MKYISHGIKYSTIKNHVNVPLFKCVFDCDCDINATLTIRAIGLYRLFSNGEELNRSLFTPICRRLFTGKTTTCKLK